MRIRLFMATIALLLASGGLFAGQKTTPAKEQSKEKPASPAAQTLSPATVTMLQKRAEDFLRNLYAWGPDFTVKADEPKASSIPNLYELQVQVSLQGQSDTASVYMTADGRYMLRGEISDTNANPFEGVRKKLTLDGWPSKGKPDAPVTIVEFGDYECPNCRQLDSLLRQLLPENPEVRLVFKDFPLEQIHPWAMTAALTGRCAYQQNPDAFWKFHDAVYDSQEKITPDNAYDKLLELATAANLEADKLRTCVADPQTAESVRKSIAEGVSIGVNGTPTSFINGRTVGGANDPTIRQYIEYELHNIH
jgi:protein-disulfide isomerase